ncbi:MAG: BMP family ABC transporter substrate-binding protein [Gemmatimonas sp.]|nr:BMP family ABC transporter substrate-binding protein [Gemmatimonas sp.]
MLTIRRLVTRFFIFNIAVGILAACSPAKDTSNSSADADGFTVALLTPGPISDQSWNGGAYEGLLRIRDSLGARVSHIQTKTPAEFEENFRQYGASGYSLVFGHGFEFQDAAARVGPAFPKTVFITTGGTRTSANVAAMSFAFEQPSYLAGIIAASVSKSGIIGCIGGTELPPVKSGFAAFTQGVHALNPKARVVTAYLGNWDDAGAGKEQALAQIARGVDVIYQNADAAGLGIFQAAKESQGVHIIGSNSDQNHVAPTVTLGSVVINLPNAFMSIAREVKSGAFIPRVHVFDTRSGVMKWVLNSSMKTVVPPRVLQMVDSVEHHMLDGTFVPPWPARIPEDE